MSNNTGFTIPLDKDELVRTHFGDYGHRDIIPVQLINKEINGISQQQITQSCPVEIIQAKQDVFLSIVVHGNKVEIAVLLRSFGRILRLVQNLVGYLEKKNEQFKDLEVEEAEKVRLLDTVKLAAYIISATLCLIEDQIADSTNNINNVGKRKKNIQKSDFEEEWEHQREKAMETLHRWLQLPLKNLWTPPIVEDTFVSTVSQICYKILEKTKDIRSKNVRYLIFQILGLLVKKYNHGIACVVRILQLAKFHEALAAPIGAGVATMVNECGCSGLIKEIAKEIELCEPTEADARNFSLFLESIASTQPNIVVPILDNIADYLDNVCYVLRNCAIGVMGIIVSNVLTGEDLTPEQRIKRDECLTSLETHILDTNAYVRSKVLQVWQKLCCDGAIPLSWQNRLVAATVLRLEDKSANVRKQALQLLRAILQSNPFASKMNTEDFTQKLEKAKAELKQLQTDIYHTVGAEEEKEELWKTQLPLIEKAINKLSEQYNEEDDDEEKEKGAEEEIDIKETFDKIQEYILKDKCSKAVKYLYKIFMQSGLTKEMRNLPQETKKEALQLFMYKIFMNSSSKLQDKVKEKSLATDQEELKQLDQIKVKKKLVDYLQNCLTFCSELEKTIPIVSRLLYSVNPGDAIEACSLLGAAYQFQISGALDGVRKALFQIFCRDQSVRDNVAIVYKEIYLDQTQGTNRGRALQSVKSLIQLLDGMLPGQSTALSRLIVLWRTNNELDSDALRVMWEMFSLKLPNTTPLESRAALMILSMAAQAESDIITDNLDVLIKVGLGPRAETDLLLARDTCRAFLNIKQDPSKDLDKSPIRYNNDHEIFNRVCFLLKEKFFEEEENGYISFATDAINVIYHLADQPSLLMKDVLVHVGTKSKLVRSAENNLSTVEVPSCYISRFLYIVGHAGIREMVFLDQSVYNELKRRNAVKEKKKQINARISSARRKSLNVSTMSSVSTVSTASSVMGGSAHRSIRSNNKNDDETEEMEGAVADDADAEHINACLEHEILSAEGLFSKILPLVYEVCRNPEKYPDETIQAMGALALSKLMTISSEFCENNLQLLVTILERSPHPQIRANILIGLADLMTRFPNQIEPWTSHIYGRLKDDDLTVRSTCVRMLSNLILGEMIRVKGQVAQLALCMVDENEMIKSDTKQLFKDLSQKGNALYNVMPDILSCLSDSDLNLSEKNFQEIIKYILGLLQKDRQVDSIIEKLCSRFKIATTERQWRNLSYCLSLLKFSAKGIRILIKDLPLLKEKIHNEDVRKALNTIVEQAKRRPDAKGACQELEDKIKELVDSTEDGENDEQKSVDPDTQAMPPPIAPVPKTAKAKKKVRRTRKNNDDEDEEDNDDDYSDNQSLSGNDTSTSTSSRPSRSTRANSVSRDETSANSSSEEEELSRTPRKNLRKSSRTPVQDSNKTPRNTRTPSRTARDIDSPSQESTPTGRSTRRRKDVEASPAQTSGKKPRSTRK